MKMINQNELSKFVAAREGRKVQVNIAQIKEVQKCVLLELSEHSDEDIIRLMSKMRKEYVP
jgi:hypothetical protein